MRRRRLERGGVDGRIGAHFLDVSGELADIDGARAHLGDGEFGRIPRLAGAQARGLLQLKGHKSVGGMRASIYNAMPIEGVRALVDYMREFEKEAV